jgi:hypothetical protein
MPTGAGDFVDSLSALIKALTAHESELHRADFLT